MVYEYYYYIAWPLLVSIILVLYLYTQLKSFNLNVGILFFPIILVLLFLEFYVLFVFALSYNPEHNSYKNFVMSYVAICMLVAGIISFIFALKNLIYLKKNKTLQSKPNSLNFFSCIIYIMSSVALIAAQLNFIHWGFVSLQNYQAYSMKEKFLEKYPSGKFYSEYKGGTESNIDYQNK